MTPVLPINAGSSGIKIGLIEERERDAHALLAKGTFEGVGQEPRLRRRDGFGQFLDEQRFSANSSADIRSHPPRMEKQLGPSVSVRRYRKPNIVRLRREDGDMHGVNCLLNYSVAAASISDLPARTGDVTYQSERNSRLVPEIGRYREHVTICISQHLFGDAAQ